MKYKSALMTQGSGSIEGLTASHNRGGNYFKARVVPTDPSTTRQNVVRSAMADKVQAWQLLSPAQRQAWEDFAANTPQVNSIGQTFHLTGQQAFIKANVPRNNADVMLGTSLGTVEEAPTTFNNGEGATVDPDTIFITPNTDWGYTWSRAVPDSADATLLTYRGIPQNPSRNYYGGPWQLDGATAVPAGSTGATVTLTLPSGSLYSFGDEGTSKIPVRTSMAYEDGRLSHAQQFLEVPDVLTI